MDPRLGRYTDADGQLWQICQACTEWKREEELALDPEDGLRWDVCATCENNVQKG